MQQLVLQRHAQQQQQRRDGSHLLNGNSNGLVGNDPLMRQNPGTANVLATKMYEERFKLPLHRDSLYDAAIKASAAWYGWWDVPANSSSEPTVAGVCSGHKE